MRFHRAAGLLASIGTAGALAVTAAVPASADPTSGLVTVQGAVACGVGTPTAVTVGGLPATVSPGDPTDPSTGSYRVTFSTVPPFGQKVTATVSCSVAAGNFQRTFTVSRPPSAGDLIQVQPLF